jgi:hypothetical protein
VPGLPTILAKSNSFLLEFQKQNNHKNILLYYTLEFNKKGED